MDHINTKRVLKDHICIGIGWGYHLSLIQQHDEWEGGTEIALVYGDISVRPSVRTSGLVPLNKWITFPASDYADDDDVAVDVEDYHALGFASEAELVAHVMNEAIRYVTFIDVWRSGGES